MNELIAGHAALLRSAAAGDVEIAALAADSRQVTPGALFAALPGARQDGRAFIGEAVAKGAAAILIAPGTAAPDSGAAVVVAEDPRRALALMAARFFGGQPRIVAAVTGTSGKTSTASFLRQIWDRLGHRAAYLGTLGLSAPGLGSGESLTTPEPIALHRLLADLAARDVSHLAMEASSHGLDQRRLDGVTLSAAAFTNLSRDHLDYHGTMADYLAVKLRLFADLLPAGAPAVVNADSEAAERVLAIARRRGHRPLTFGAAATADIRLLARTPHGAGQRLSLSLLGRRHEVDFPLVGLFQAENLLAALGLAIGLGAEADRLVPHLSMLTGVRGRLEPVGETPSGGRVYVDYAHKPAGLEAVLETLRPHARGKLAVVFGCGGDRDRGKRAEMGAIAIRLADRVIVTDDNPRGEDPAAIRAEILRRAPGAEEIGDRAAAIAAAIAALGAGDLLVIAGKGHETYQIVGEAKHPFDDAAVARAAIAAAGTQEARRRAGGSR